MFVQRHIESQAAESPDKIALICDGRLLTYGELNRRADQIADRLGMYGVRPEVLVGLYVERSLEMVIGLLGILKAGGAYVPLDISYPEGTIAFMLSDARVSVVLTQKKLEARLPLSEGKPRIVHLDSEWPSDPRAPQGGLMKAPIELTPDNVAYVMYTSGSEGKPKGVVVTHGNLCHYVHHIALPMEVGPNDVYLHLAPISFASSARQLIMPLCHGATVVIVTLEQRRDPLLVLELVKRYGVTLMDMVPPYWRRLNASLDPLDAESRKALLDNKLRFVNAHGEVLPPDIPKTWRQKFRHGATILNMYGQTETTGVVAVYRIPAQGEDSRVVPVGRPIACTRIYVLDEHLQPLPPGECGELCVGGPGVTRGYLNSPELTAQRFISDPFSSDSKARLYRTGDLGRQRPDGIIEVLGRMDQQIKINGIRIELGGIEAALMQHPLIREAVVLAYPMENGERRLVAYYTGSSAGHATAGELRDFLKEELPSYMMPLAFVMVEAMPLTANGKVDRRALPKPEFSRWASNRAFLAPRDPIEQQIAAIWEDALAIHPIGIDDNFLDLGGDSLLAVHVMTEIGKTFRKEISPASLFQELTIRAMADLLRGEHESRHPQCIVPIQKGGSEPPIFCIHYLGRGLAYYRPLGRHLSQQTLYGASTLMTADSDVPHPRDIRGLAAYYLRAIQIVQPRGPYRIVGFSFGGLVAFEIAQLLWARGHSVALLGLLDSGCPVKTGLSSFGGRLARHLSNLRRVGPQYILSRIRWRWFNMRLRMQLVQQRLGWLGPARNGDGAHHLAYLRSRQEHEQVNRGYQMQVYPGDITLFRARDDPDPKLGWRRFTGGELRIHDVPGDHFGMLQEPNVEGLAKELEASLEGEARPLSSSKGGFRGCPSTAPDSWRLAQG